ncbi:LacI family DNA-binding transcriptional regulator [Cohnella cholangitidis]|uniref:LacI family transcriptional regulator n=1 Tax=Cohnella cholangitidis TaxID=2598458 RepID=A0A7G5BW72_9BACL|nr:LacI family DNA-binding transcriptional regulator [Cohnella cholangitidis]QMV41206.1 LacI family transcriptional regulator [Cohnella cholangitidis]
MGKVTIKDVAKKANVSVTTVSNVLNNSGRTSPDTIRKVRQVIQELEFSPSASARNLRDKKSHLIAVVVPFLEKGRLQDNPFYWQLVLGIEEGARNHQLHVILLGVDDEESFSFVKERHLDGLIVVGTYEESPIFKKILSLDVPCVFMDSYLSDPNLYQIYLDDEMGGYLGTKHLISLGHRRIALLTGKIQKDGVNYKRWLGYRRALEEADLPYDAELIREEPVSTVGGYQAAQYITDSRRNISAVFVFSDVGAMGLIKGLQELGVQVPRDISVVGFDDLFYTDFMIPSLTTVKQNIAERGHITVQLLLEQISEESRSDSRKVVLPVSLKVRQSTAPVSHPNHENRVK